MAKYTETLRYSAILVILVLASCSSAPLKKTEVPLSPAISNHSGSHKIQTQSSRNPGLITELCSLSIPAKTTIFENRILTTKAIAKNKNSELPELKFPVPSGVLSSPFGYRRGIFHTGLDIKAPQGEDVLACADGQVVCAGTRKGYRSYGRTVLIDHGRDVLTLYAHLSEILVSAGQKVRQGQKIACVGCTGRATAPHLHLEVRRADRAFDPYACFSKREIGKIEVAKGFAGSPLGPVRVRRLSARR